MFTIQYKSCFIHGYFKNTICRVSFLDNTSKEFKSLLAAKIGITKWHKDFKRFDRVSIKSGEWAGTIAFIQNLLKNDTAILKSALAEIVFTSPLKDLVKFP